MATLMTQSWESIRAFYSELTDTQPELTTAIAIRGMVELTRAIEHSKYESGLHAWTSMHDLCIVQTPVSYPYTGPRLMVSPLPGGKLEFRYFDAASNEKRWHRVVGESEGFARLELFVEQLHWFTNAP